MLSGLRDIIENTCIHERAITTAAAAADIYRAFVASRRGHKRCKSLQRIVDTHRFNTLEYLLCVFTVAVIYLAHHARISIGQYIVIRGIQFTVGENEHRSFVRGMVASKIDGSPPPQVYRDRDSAIIDSEDSLPRRVPCSLPLIRGVTSTRS